MNIKRIIASLAAVMMLTAAAGCGNKNSGNSYVSTETSKTAPTMPVPGDDGVEAAADGPRLYMKDAKASPGDTVEITMAVDNAQAKWAMCGIHITYPDFLKCKMFDEAEDMIEYTRGDASQYATANVGMLWREGLPEVLTSQNLGCIFFTEVFGGKNMGLDGDIATFYFEVPADAPKGEYPLGFYYRDTDVFIDAEQDKSMQKYVFENWQPGTLTIE